MPYVRGNSRIFDSDSMNMSLIVNLTVAVERAAKHRNLCIHHVTILSELRYFMGVKIVNFTMPGDWG